MAVALECHWHDPISIVFHETTQKNKPCSRKDIGLHVSDVHHENYFVTPLLLRMPATKDTELSLRL